MTVCDVAVVGAGPAGAVAAHVLARAGRRVALIGAASPARQRIGEALIGAARPLLDELGLLAAVTNGPHLPCYGNVVAWDEAQPASVDFIGDPNGLGWHLDRCRFDAALRDEALRSGVVWHKGSCRSLERAADTWELQLSRTRVSARWVVDATGRAAAVARRLGVTRRRDQPLSAYYAWLPALAQDLDGRTLIEATEAGWWYSARLPGGHRVAAFHTAASRQTALPVQLWRQQLEQTSQIFPLLAPLSDDIAVRMADAGGYHLEHYAGDGWVAVGDAALAFEPLSSQGLYNALYTGMQAARALIAATAGQPQALDGYAATLTRIRAAYCQNRRAIYGMVKRWPSSTFWLSRGALGT